MEKMIWVIEEDKADMLDIQRKINGFGGVRTICIFSRAMLEKIIGERLGQDDRLSSPSLILVNYSMADEDGAILEMLKMNPKLAGVPLFFLTEEGEQVNREECYLRGAMVVMAKPVNQNGLVRIRQAAAQYEMTKSYERIFQRQVSELAAAKEIHRLNIQLESRNEFLYRVFGKYFSDELLEVILERPEGEVIGGDRREIAVLMADLRGFSSKSEEMTPDELMDLLNCFFGTMVEIIAEYNGTVIEFMGDGILAVFGAPMKNEQYAESAIAAAVSMQNAMKGVQDFCVERGIPKVEMGIGVHCGETFVGNVGSERMMRYNVIGRVVNECSRIEGCSCPGQIFASERIISKTACEVMVEERICVEAKGIREPLWICEVSGIGGEYQCSLEMASAEEMHPLTEKLILELYPIQNKVINEKPVLGVCTEISRNSCVVEVMEGQDGTENCRLYTDVEMRTAKGQEKAAFTGVYAKIVKVQGSELKLRFTHRNREFDDFMSGVMGDKE